ncbi:DNA polymerase III subunit alpha [Vagococcus intermedius]|uniref:DNA polymerase III subunit alpha n=1 Tax=Vagococcus intermedius TaxID=2991418 RepID=A0AAF0CWH3_9ENTE|nr:DNA polymerase III subunit alpha [Vagococcus intermedius]WEG74164.1 DNA polymerase III subunit alpha [Vagococcus intermedius]WEG76244.1 DNA polymerase III subunit alpha [Vagococcus intermedius]
MATAQLQVLTAYSLLASTNRIEELVQKAKNYGYDALAITDLDVMHGVAEFYQACQKVGIKPLIGLTIRYRYSRQDEYDSKMILLAKDEIGYQNLLKISTLKMERAKTDSFYFNQIKNYLHHLVVIISDDTSHIGRLFQQQSSELETSLTDLQTLVDHGSLYGGISIVNEEEPRKMSWLNFLKGFDIELVALHEVRYLNPSDDFSLRVLEHIEAGTKLSTDTIQQTGQYYLPTPDNFVARLKNCDLSTVGETISKVVEACQFEMKFDQTLLPHYKVPEGRHGAEFLREICFNNLPTRVKDPDDRYIDRLNYELSVITEMGFVDYFLIIWDVMNFARSKKIAFGPGRGSAAGSLVSFVTHITDVDPIQYDLLFERFLNKERYTMPDIDLDIPDNRRDEILNYVSQKHGHHHVAQIATFGTLAAKMALRDVSRVFGLSQNEANQWSNAIPNVLKITLKEALEQSKELKQLVNETEKNRLIFEVASKIEGLPRHISTHAAGVVISDQDLTELVPLQSGTGDIPLTQFTMNDVEAIGLLKMDFLGLRNLSILDEAVQQVKRVYNQELVLQDIPMNDELTLKLFRQARTVGVFQFESPGIKNVLRKLGPTSIEDVAAVNALYRPGPMENIDLFVARKKGEEPIDYPHESLQEILGVTYGIIVYQEQIMQVAAKMAGFSLGEADILRRAISKKKKDVLDDERRHFVEGSLEQGYDVAVANKVYDYIERFANYGFNRSHAMAYAFIAYWLAYLKVHYPTPFFVALLNSVRHNLGKIKEYVNDARRFGLKIKGPHINRSHYGFYLDKEEIIFGFNSLKGVRSDFTKNILNIRKENGHFTSFDDFLLRIDRKFLKTENLLPLIYSGAFDALHSNRRQLVEDLDSSIKNILYSGGSMDLLSILSLKKEEIEDYSIPDKLEQEASYLGTYLSGHPVDEFRTLKIMKNVKNVEQLTEQVPIKLLLLIKNIRIIRTKKGEQMAFVDGHDASGETSVTIFPGTYRQISKRLDKDKVILVQGKVSRSKFDKALQVVADSIEFAEDYQDKLGPKICYLKIEEADESETLLIQLKGIFKQHPGITPVILYFEKNAQKLVLSDEFWVNESINLKNELSCIVNKGNIVFK